MWSNTFFFFEIFIVNSGHVKIWLRQSTINNFKNNTNKKTLLKIEDGHRYFGWSKG